MDTTTNNNQYQVLSVMEKGGGQLEVPLDKLAQHVVRGLEVLVRTVVDHPRKNTP